MFGLNYTLLSYKSYSFWDPEGGRFEDFSDPSHILIFHTSDLGPGGRNSGLSPPVIQLIKKMQIFGIFEA